MNCVIFTYFCFAIAFKIVQTILTRIETIMLDLIVKLVDSWSKSISEKSFSINLSCQVGVQEPYADEGQSVFIYFFCKVGWSSDRNCAKPAGVKDWRTGRLAGRQSGGRLLQKTASKLWFRDRQRSVTIEHITAGNRHLIRSQSRKNVS